MPLRHIFAPAEKAPSTDREFYVPTRGMELEPYLAAEEKQGIHHLARYHWACSVAGPRRRLLDVASGAGYGAKLYAETFPGAEVLGVDYDERAIAYAERNYRARNLGFRRGDIVSWRYADGASLGTFDFISTFDTLEHLLHREIALINLTENLEDDGLLLLSTPCKGQNLLNPAWEHHKIEYGHSDLLNLLRRFFRRVLVSEDGTLPNQAYWDEKVNKDRVRYLTRANPIACMDPIKLRPSRKK